MERRKERKREREMGERTAPARGSGRAFGGLDARPPAVPVEWPAAASAAGLQCTAHSASPSVTAGEKWLRGSSRGRGSGMSRPRNKCDKNEPTLGISATRMNRRLTRRSRGRCGTSSARNGTGKRAKQHKRAPKTRKRSRCRT